MSYGSMPAGRAIEGTNSGLLREPNSNARGGRKRSRRAVLFSVVWSRLVMNRPLIGERAAKCGPPLLRSPPGVWRASQLRQFLGAQLTKSCRAGGSNALFLGWSQFPEFEEEQEVVGPLQRAAYDEGPAEARKGQATSPPAPSTIARFILQGARKRMRTHPIGSESWLRSNRTSECASPCLFGHPGEDRDGRSGQSHGGREAAA